MKLIRITKYMLMITILSLVYIHLQMQIFDLAYQGKKREKYARSLTEENGNETYNILKLKSANNLGFKLLTEDSDMQFMEYENIVSLEPEEPINSGDEKVLVSNAGLSKSLFSFLSLDSEAVAQPQK